MCGPESNGTLPNPRTVSELLHPDENTPATVTHIFTIFGQLVDHDISLAPEIEFEAEEGEEEPNCCDEDFMENHPDCFPIFTPCDAKSFLLGKEINNSLI